MKETRENWGSRAGFVLAAIGSAVGLGNVWRFPHETYANGGGAFLIPYIVAMLSIGIPLLILEFSLGHYTQKSAPFAFGKINKKMEFIGWWAIVSSFIIVCYYAVVLAWCFNYLIDSLYSIFNGSELPWLENANDRFFKDYLKNNGTFAIGTVRPSILFSLIAVWVMMFLCIFRGVHYIGKLVLFIVPIPWFMLILLLWRSLTMEGSMSGVEYFLEPNWAMLGESHIWRTAFGHVCFSMSIGFGTMITYASYLHRKSDINNNAMIIGLADLGTSFVAGLTVFATLGAFALEQQKEISEVLDSSLGLAFVAFPKALANMPYPKFFSTVFFFALFILGLDSAFSLTEASLSSIKDKTGWSRVKILTVMSGIGCILGLLYITEGGLQWFATVDSFINEGEFGITCVVLVQCIALAWFFNLNKLKDHANERSDWKVGNWWIAMIRYVVPGVLTILIIWGLYDKINSHVYEYIDHGGNSVGKIALADCSLVAGDGSILGHYDKKSGDILDTEGKLIATIVVKDNTVIDSNKNIIGSITKSGGFIVDANGNLIGSDMFGLAMNCIAILLSFILALWPNTRLTNIKEFE